MKAGESTVLEIMARVDELQRKWMRQNIFRGMRRAIREGYHPEKQGTGWPIPEGCPCG
ncbi:hypothetical protein GCM10007416_04880 [Kroppenstedtia guangzhouensis]|uniref:Uncharacterized protein n=1 Tax=Kroppenstedtia guangzhouensis TaxID=1274356 RepID=A0ABQ1G1T7_9BACL|nr:hypothetical protein GCM10007416_04880 [Kroppenstedtia guangzhouensis]